jgi:hypothetical protein
MAAAINAPGKKNRINPITSGTLNGAMTAKKYNRMLTANRTAVNTPL